MRNRKNNIIAKSRNIIFCIIIQYIGNVCSPDIDVIPDVQIFSPKDRKKTGESTYTLHPLPSLISFPVRQHLLPYTRFPQKEVSHCQNIQAVTFRMFLSAYTLSNRVFDTFLLSLLKDLSKKSGKLQVLRLSESSTIKNHLNPNLSFTALIQAAKSVL